MRLALALVAFLVGPASAQPKPHRNKPARQTLPATTTPAAPARDYVYTPEPLTLTQHKEGEYGGVEPGQTPTTPTGKHHQPPKSTLNWIGFEAKDGGATVFFQAAAQFEIAQHVEGNQLVAVLGLPRLGANTWRQVDTRFFENPLSGIVAKAVSARGATKTSAAHGSGIEVRFSFKNAADAREATMRTATEADGQYYVYLAFPTGTASATPATTTTTKSTPPPKPDTEQ
jgi:hypothetical protein